MNKLTSLALVGLLLTPSVYSHELESDSNFYFGAQVNLQKILFQPGRDYKTLGLSLGYKINDFLAIESKVNAGVSGVEEHYVGSNSRQYLEPDPLRIEDSWFTYSPLNEDGQITVGMYEEDIELQSSISLKPYFSLTKNIEVFAEAGISYSRMRVKNTYELRDIENAEINRGGGNPDYSFVTKGILWGAGLTFKANESLNITFSYNALPKFDIRTEGDYSKRWHSYSLGFTRSF